LVTPDVWTAHVVPFVVATIVPALPTAVQLAGHPLADDTLLQVAAQIEAARPWIGRTPPL